MKFLTALIVALSLALVAIPQKAEASGLVPVTQVDAFGNVRTVFVPVGFGFNHFGPSFGYFNGGFVGGRFFGAGFYHRRFFVGGRFVGGRFHRGFRAGLRAGRRGF